MRAGTGRQAACLVRVRVRVRVRVGVRVRVRAGCLPRMNWIESSA